MAKNLFEAEIFTQPEKLELLSKEAEIRCELLEEPSNFEKIEELAVLLYHKRDYDAAIKLYKKVIANSNDPKKIAFLGYMYFEKEDYQMAVDYLKESIKLDPNDSFVYFLLGNAYSRMGNVLKAVQSYDLAIFQNLDIYQAHLDFAKKYESIGLIKRAIKEYTIAYEIDPRDKELKSKIEKLKGE